MPTLVIREGELTAHREPNGPPTFVTYLIGNAGALLVGLISAYVALTFGHAANSAVLNIRTVDAMTYFSEARLILAGHAALMYDWTALAHIESAVVGAAPVTFGVLINPYPPFFVTSFLPLALLPYTVAYIVWLAVNCILLVSVLYVLERYTGLEGRKALAFRWIALSFLPVFMALANGQASAYLLALLAACLFAVRSDHPLLAGAALAAASIKPVYVLPILLVFLIQRRWRILVWYVATGVLLILAPVPIFGVEIYRSYLQLLAQISSWQGRSVHHPLWYHHVPIAPGIFAAQWNHSLAGFTQLFLANPGSTIAYAGLSVGVLSLVVVSARQRSEIEISFGIAIIAGLLVSPHTLAYDLSLLLIPVAIALRFRLIAPRGLRVALPAVLVLGYLAITIGYRLAFIVPVQVSVFGDAALLVWMSVLASRVQHASTACRGDIGLQPDGARVVDAVLETA